MFIECNLRAQYGSISLSIRFFPRFFGCIPFGIDIKLSSLITVFVLIGAIRFQLCVIICRLSCVS